MADMGSRLVLQQMPQYRLDPEESAAYEVALEAINHANAALSPLIAAATRDGDPERLRTLNALRDRCFLDRNDLSPGDRNRVAEVTRRYRELRDKLRAQERPEATPR